MHEYFLHKQNSQSFKETASALNAQNYQSTNDVVELKGDANLPLITIHYKTVHLFL